MTVSGVIHVLYGIGAIFGQSWYAYGSGAAWAFDAKTWGWSMLVGGILLMISSSLLLAGNMLGRSVAVLIALASLVANLALFTTAPIWSTIAVVVNLLIIYAVTAHGREMKQLRRDEY